MAKVNKQTKLKHSPKLHRRRLVLFVGLALGLIGLQFSPSTTQSGQVLAYATNVGIGALADATNQQRSSNSLGHLAINSQLNSGAQAKAAHMIAHNYWSHTAPDGTEPWHFFTQAGYDYVHAGENLAYGFDSSEEVVDAWMNSSGHRANVLGTYENMGFGIANGDSYQGGEYTVVVAFYGTEQTPAATPEPEPAPTASPAPATKPTQSTPTPTHEPTPTATPVPEPHPEPTPAEQPEPQAELVTTEPTSQPVEPQRVTNLQNILSGNASWAMYASIGLISASAIGFFTTHLELVRRGWRRSAHFILVHPALDTAALVALVAALLTTTVGFIR